MSAVRDVEIAVHTTLVVLHGLAALWHLRQHHWVHGGLHAAAVVLDGTALARHLHNGPEGPNYGAGL